jgi:hemolysin activation/secretion protein
LKLNKTVIAALCLSSVVATTCYAAPADYEQQQAAKRQEEEQQAQIKEPYVSMQKKEKSKDKDEQKALEATIIPREKYRFKINEFVIDSGKSRKFAWLLQELEPYKGKRIGAQGVNVLTKMLTKKIHDRGFITTSVSVSEQNMQTGKLVFTVTPGYVEDIRFAKPTTFGTWRTAFPNRPGNILNVRDLEQGLEQMRRVPKQQVDMKLKPGSDSNHSIVVLDVKRQRMWGAGLSIDDSGLENTGRLQVSGNISLYNPTGMNDILSYSYSKDGEHQDSLHGTKDNSFFYSLPLGKYTFNASRYYNESYQQVPALVPFESRGKTTTWQAGLQRVLYRDSTRKTQGYFKIIKRRKENYIDGEEVRVQRLNTAAYQIGLMERCYIGRGVIDAMVYYQKGMPWLNAEPGFSDNTEGFMNTRYALWGMNFYYETPFQLGNWQPSYSLTFRGQYTKDMLYMADQFSIGGRYTVRGFNGENTLSAENGYILRNEIRFPLKHLNMEPYIGIDYGRVWGPSDGYLLGNSLAGAVLGIRGKGLLQVNYDVFIGTPIYKPEGFKAGKTACGFNVYCQI